VTAKELSASVDALIAAAQRADATLNPANGLTIVAVSQCGAAAIDTGRPLIVLLSDADGDEDLPGRRGTGWDLLTRLYGAERSVVLLPSGSVSTIAACRSDGTEGEDALYLAAVAPLEAFATPWTMPWLSARLRAPDGCPWDREQTHASLAKHLIEEAWELHDAIAALDSASDVERPRAIADLAEELGDVLLQVVLHSQIAEERGDFDLADVQDGLVRKIVRRHPHVFGEASAATTRDVQRNWEAIKAGERAAAGEGEKVKGALDGVSRGLPALSASRELQDRASAVGYDWPTLDGVRAKISEELAELDEALAEAGNPDQITSTQAASAAALAHAQEELGDVLAVIVNLGRRSGIDAEAALRGANDKFRRRFGDVERRAATRGISLKDADFTTLDALWDEAKAAEREVKG
jgi:tetrapyrrole methylase family protein/MazG family protein